MKIVTGQSQTRLAKFSIWAVLMAATVLATGCNSKESNIPGFAELERQVEGQAIGADADQWIEYKNMVGDWERTGLIFGYIGDFEECQKAIAGMKQANPNAQYRCVPANRKQAP